MEYTPLAEPPPASSSGRSGGRGIKLRVSPRVRAVLRWTWPLGVAAVVGVGVGVGVAAAIHMPRVESLADYKPGLITQLYDDDGKVFASYARQRRVMLRENEIPEVLKQAVIAIEDNNFYQHGGLDAMGVLRAAVTNLRTGRKAEGASTITMQLARQLFLSPEKKWRRKIEEALLAVELEKTLSKQQILTLYMNVVFLGHGNYGMEAAARFYFNKSVGDLTLPEAATLAGIPQQPSRLSPYQNHDVVLHRRNRVLERMEEEDFITHEQYEEAVAKPLLVVQHHPKDDLGPYFAEEVRKHLEATYGSDVLLESGLQVRTTLDATIQHSAEKALHDGLLDLDHRKGWRGPLYNLGDKDVETETLPAWPGLDPTPDRWYEGIVEASDSTHAQVRIGRHVYDLTSQGIEWTRRSAPSTLLKRGDVAWFRLAPPADDAGEPVLHLEQEPQLEGAALVLDSATGAVRAMVGGWDYDRNKFNRATQARRQVGSAFKPFVYGAALEQGFTPADTLFDAPAWFVGADGRLSYAPHNYHPGFFGILTLRRALEQSINVTAVKLLDLVGVSRVIDFAHRCGIQEELPPYPSLALGSADLGPLELASAYASIANRGTWVEPYLIDKVSTPNGRVLEEHVTKTATSTTPAIAYVLTHMLEGVIDAPKGTGHRLADLDLDIAGKTGTTDDYSDAWFVGFTPRYTLLTWVGYDVKRTIGRGMDGSRTALPIWREMAVDGLEQGWLTKGERFAPPPPGVTMMPVDYLTGLLPGPGSTNVDEAFVVGTEPARVYSERWAQIMALPWYQQRPFYIPKEGERMPENAPPDAAEPVPAAATAPADPATP